jgi:hypothetical protein
MNLAKFIMKLGLLVTNLRDLRNSITTAVTLVNRDMLTQV